MNAGVLQENADLFVRMNIFSQIKTGYLLLDMLISSMIMMYLPTLFNRCKHVFKDFSNYLLYYNSNKLTLEGMRTINISWNTRTQNIFSTRFRALWYHIQSTQNLNKDIHSIKEYPSSDNKRDEYDEKDSDEYNKIENDIFIVNQNRSFKLEEDIWCRVRLIEEEVERKDRGRDQQSSKFEKIIIELYSKNTSVENLKRYIDRIAENYMEDLYNSRHGKLFIYSLSGFKNKNENDMLQPTWDECRFKSSRFFNTIFFDQKQMLQEKINFFENNQEWYEKEGHPYTMGIALHGPPGTGKTSVIKCIANHLKRHLIVIPLSKIKTQTQFNKCFFDDEYNHKNAKQTIGFEKKIIVFEDLDCMSDIILERNNGRKTPSKERTNNTSENGVVTKDELLQTIKQGMNPDSCKSDFATIFDKNNAADDNDELTLSFILNVIDGIRETPGRIMIVTSNHYDKLDKAFTRPGRIDVSLEMKNASVEIIEEIVDHYYKSPIPDTIRMKLKDGVVSPATLINLRFKCSSKDEFLTTLVNEHFTSS